MIRSVCYSKMRKDCTFQIPQRDVNARQCRHKDRSTTIEPEPPDQLPDVFDVAGPMISRKADLHMDTRDLLGWLTSLPAL